MVGDFFAVIGLDSGFANRRSFEVFAERLGVVFMVVGFFVEMDDPLFLVQVVEPAIQCGVVSQVFELCREYQWQFFIFVLFAQ